MARKSHFSYPNAFVDMPTKANPLFNYGELSSEAMAVAVQSLAQATQFFNNGAQVLRVHKEQYFHTAEEDGRTLEKNRLRVAYNGRLEEKVLPGNKVMLARYCDYQRRDIQVPNGVFGFANVEYVQPAESPISNYEIKLSDVNQFPAIVENDLASVGLYICTLGYPKIKPTWWITNDTHRLSHSKISAVQARFILNYNRSHLQTGKVMPAIHEFIKDYRETYYGVKRSA
ncbi:MAG TPA: hypothetical protein VK158_00790 [Acidobacteriota bacterium]|nr:hypothetical protein [Acidobacteriota bacterium]